MDICTKVTLRQRLLPSGKITLYLDYYPAIRNPKTNKSQRHEYMGIYLYGNPTNRVQRDFNQTMLEKAEIIRCRRQEQVINRQFGFIDHTQQREDFLAYFEETTTLPEMENRVYALPQIHRRQMHLRRRDRGVMHAIPRVSSQCKSVAP